MSTARSIAQASLEKYRIPETSIYLVGLFDEGVTVLSQQRRALNLVWSLVESGTLKVERSKPDAAKDASSNDKQSIAIIGGGFSGLTAAAGLIAKGFPGRIAIFEQRDTLLPFQNGSDTRWLHPNIYDWPTPGSEVNSAMLPVMNWTAARASDVAVQSIANWRNTAKNHEALELYCNARHVRVDPSNGASGHLVEWTGERRQLDGTSGTNGEGGAGQTDLFDHVILATGYGLETGGGISYWRNDMTGQPNLERPRLTYILSGQGDGAMIDLLRLRISNFRQDRILYEMFGSTTNLRRQLESIKASFDPANPEGFVESLKNLQRVCPVEFTQSLEALKRRLRRDTEVILGTRVTKIRDLLESPNIRISFQNRVLVYFLYRCGGFSPVTGEVAALAKANGVPKDRIITRHGINRHKMIQSVLSNNLASKVADLQKKKQFVQSSEPMWSGGYFGIKGLMSGIKSRPDGEKADWRMEYLPGPTRLLASTFCSSVAGFLGKNFKGERLRVTLHRAMRFGTEEVLQQCCPYFGVNADKRQGSAGRTFPASNGTIGAAYRTRLIIRAKRASSNRALKDAMKELNLNEASRQMSNDVNFLLAIPIVEPDPYTALLSVAAVLYVDGIGDFFVEDDKLAELVGITQAFVNALEDIPSDALNGIYNAGMPGTGLLSATQHPLFQLPEGLEEVIQVEPPRAFRPFQLNFESSDFIPVKHS